MPFIKVATVQEVPPGRGKEVLVNGRQVAIFNANGTFYAIGNVCPHRGAPLAEGELEGTQVCCPWHAARFDVTTGQYLSPPARSDVPAYPVQVVGEEIQIEVKN
ncbi:MAG: non-heme iron oxygenase ferredoxin subunit [Planctomycetes bacterium]|nr:non-heme iron oxygenase ferredoxin subunit [Planctomycetota bacterium]